MRKFAIISRKGVTTLQEVEIEIVSALEDPSVMWLGKGEYKAHIMLPVSLHEKQEDGSLKPPVWFSHAFFHSEEEARKQAEHDIQKEMERVARKSHTQFDPIACLAKCKEIQAVCL